MAGFDNNKYVLKNLDFDYWGHVCQGRLTLASGDPIPDTEITAATTIYYTPYKGNRIALYDTSDAVWKHYEFSEISIAIPATTSTNYDIWAYDSSGSVTLELLAWTNQLTRATALTTQDGIYVKTGDASRRYLGTFTTSDTSGETEYSLSRRFLWNYYNRVDMPLVINETTGSWSYATSTWRSLNADNANRVEIIVGVVEDRVDLTAIGSYAQNGSGSAVGNYGVGIGEDVTNANTGYLNGAGSNVQASALGNIDSNITMHTLNKYPAGVGYRYYQMVEIGGGTGVVILGNGASSRTIGLSGSFKG